MPELCRFYGIVIAMYWNDQNPPHFHAQYGESAAEIDIHTFAVLRGRLPPRALALTMEWASLHQAELLDCCRRARAQRALRPIPPLA